MANSIVGVNLVGYFSTLYPGACPFPPTTLYILHQKNPLPFFNLLTQFPTHPPTMGSDL
jgi:hypothetical protein